MEKRDVIYAYGTDGILTGFMVSSLFVKLRPRMRLL